METTDVLDITWTTEATQENRHDNQQQQYYETYTSARFITGLILYPIICLFGLTGNTLILVVLAHKAVLSSTDVLLVALAVSDAVKLISDLLYSATCATIEVNHDAGQTMYAYLYPYAHFVFSAAVSVSAWLVVSLAVERYLLICWPTRTRALTSAARSRVVAGIVVLLMSSIAVPSALRYRTVRVSSGNGTWYMDVELTQLWRVDAFVWTYNWTQSLLRSIIPVIILIVTGFAIVAALRRRPSMRVDDRKVAVRRRIAVMLVVVVIVFVVCITPDAIMSALYLGYTEADSYLVKAVREITDMMLAVNAAVNFVIYVVFNRGFRDRLVSQLCCRPVMPSYGSTTTGRVVHQTDSSCCWPCGEISRRQRNLANNDVEMTSRRGVTVSPTLRRPSDTYKPRARPRIQSDI